MKQVFNPKRFQVLGDTTIYGKVVEVVWELDGDYHVDIKTSNAVIVTEVVCAHKSIYPFNCPCKGYKNMIALPNKGDSVAVSGPYVIDNPHDIFEVHPIQKIVVFKK